MNKYIFPIIALLSTQAFAGSTGLTEPDVKWDKKTITVCFGDSTHVEGTRLIRAGSRDLTPQDILTFSEDHKKLIQDIIQKEYSIQETGMEFAGFENCANSLEQYDAVIFRTDREKFTYGRAAVGENGELRFSDRGTSLVKIGNKKRAYVMLNTVAEPRLKITRNEFLEMTALHEFGHLAGLRHEHARVKEAEKDNNCTITKQRFNETEFLSTKKSGKYDPNSIMNYCHMNNLAFNTGLKFSDKEFNLVDPTIFSESTVDGKKVYELKIKLSLGDKKALKGMYGR